MIILILSGLILGVSVGVLYYAYVLLRRLKHILHSIKNYEILIHGDDMFILPPDKIKQLYQRTIDDA